MKKLVITLAAALIIATTGCGDSKNPIVTFVSRSNSDSVPHLFTLNESTKQATEVSITMPNTAYFVASNSSATEVVYCRYTGTNWDIFSMGTDSVEKQLTTDADACEAVFSPDGKTIAFVSGQTGDFLIYTMNADGSNQQAFYTPASGTLDFWYPEFSADGKSLAFYVETLTAASAHRHSTNRAPMWRSQRVARHAKTTARPAAAPTQNGWYTMSLTASDPTLAYATTSWWGPAVFSTDGKKLLFTMWDGTEDNINSVNLDGSGFTPLTTNTDTYSFSPVPYKNLILFNRYNSDTSSWDIYVMNQDGSNQTLLHTTASTWETLLDSYWSGD